MNDIESALLSCALVSETCAVEMVSAVSSDWFADATHRKIYEIVREFVSAGRPVDVWSVSGANQHVSNRCQQIADMGVNPSSFAEYVAGVRRAWLGRTLGHLGEHLSAAARTGGDIDAVLADVSSRVLELGADRPGDTMVDAIRAAELGWERASAPRDNDNRSSTGFPDLDVMIGGFQPGRLYLVGARPGQGKSGLLFGWAADIAAAGKTVVSYSLEMPVSEVMLRLACRRSGVSLHKANANRSNLDDLGRLKAAFDALGKTPLWIDDLSSSTMADITAQSRRRLAGQRAPRGAIIVDYLQLMGVDSRDETRDQQIGSMTRGLKGLAKTLNVPVIVASQLNREVEKRDVKKPQLADLRESGSIEQDADVVMMLYRPEYYQAGSSPGQAELIVAKNRSGPTGTINLRFDSQTVSFSAK